MYLSVGAFACVGKCRPFRAHIILSVCTQGSVRAFGTLATLGYAGVSCLRHSLFEIIALRGTSKAEV